MPPQLYLTYNHVHHLIQTSAPHILSAFRPDLIIAIGGGGYIPARILRSFLKQPHRPNIPIQAIGLSLYEQHGTAADPAADPTVPAAHVTRTQWLDLRSLQLSSLVGKSVLIVDEVDDTRTTLEYAVRELERDVAAAAAPDAAPTRFAVFVLHNKDKEKKGRLPEAMMREGRYLAARTTEDVWIHYPWEATWVFFFVERLDGFADVRVGILKSTIDGRGGSEGGGIVHRPSLRGHGVEARRHADRPSLHADTDRPSLHADTDRPSLHADTNRPPQHGMQFPSHPPANPPSRLSPSHHRIRRSGMPSPTSS